MLKVYLSGFERPYSVVGEYLTEDERYLVIRDGVIKRQIPHSRIVQIEDISAALEERPTMPSRQYVIPSKTQVSADEPREIQQIDATAQNMGGGRFESLVKNGMKQMLGMKDGAPDSAPIGKRPLTIIISGAVQDTFSIEVPGNSFAPNVYTPALAKEVSMHPEVKRIMDNGVIFSGVPTVVGDTIHIETANLKDKIKNASDGITLASKAVDSIAKFKRPEREFNKDFSMLGKTQFPFKRSPFDGPVPLSDEEDTVETSEEDQNENSGQEEADGEGQAEEPML